MMKKTDKEMHEAMLRLKSTGLVAAEFDMVPRSVSARISTIERRYGIKYERIQASPGSMEMRAEMGFYAKPARPAAPSLPPAVQMSEPKTDPVSLDALIKQAIGKYPRTIADLAERFNVSVAEIDASLARLSAQHVNVYRRDDTVSIEKQLPHAHNDELHTYVSDEAGHYKFGIISDNHFGSRHCRLDVNDDLYDWFAAEKVDRVYNAGNWIEGEFRFNKFELTHVGMQQQVDFFCERYPKRPGITTYYVAGDDHEGWYQQQTGINIGAFTETNAREKYGRSDLRYMGYVEAFVKLRHAVTGVEAQMLVQHPGGGSSYATSYAPQKSVESLQGGEKPAVWIFGHWHKIFSLLIRNVICIGAGCTKDLDTFGRKKKLSYHIGGTILELWQNPRTGAIERWRVEHKQKFDRGYDNGNFDHVGTAEAA